MWVSIENKDPKNEDRRPKKFVNAKTTCKLETDSEANAECKGFCPVFLFVQSVIKGNRGL